MSLLTDSFIEVDLASGGSRHTSLPELLALLAQDHVSGFTHLRPHQAPAWHAFLVQLVTLALLRSGQSSCTSAEQWRSALRGLTPDHPNDEPWRMVVDDWTVPALLQPPCVRADQRKEFKREFPTPDTLDVLVTAKNHDLKAQRMRAATADEWLYALVTLQTTEGFLGAGNYGIVRMNGGFASRPFLRCADPALGAGGQVFRDVRALLALHDQVLQLARKNNVGCGTPVYSLLWLLPWDGMTSLALDNFDPLGIEVCRCVRLTQNATGFTALGAVSKMARIHAKDAKGVVADPWIPINRDEIKAFTVTAKGFSYQDMANLLDDTKFTSPLLAIPTSEEKKSGRPLVIRAAALARGQGKTEGFHSRSIELSPPSIAALMAEERAFTHRAACFVELAATVAGKVLRPALIQLVQGKDDPDWRKPTNGPITAPWLSRFDADIDRTFFGELDRSFQSAGSDEDAEYAWSRTIEAIAKVVFEAAVEAAPRTDQRRVLAHARAAMLLNAALYKHLPTLRAPQQETTDEAL